MKGSHPSLKMGRSFEQSLQGWRCRNGEQHMERCLASPIVREYKLNLWWQNITHPLENLKQRECWWRGQAAWALMWSWAGMVDASLLWNVPSTRVFQHLPQSEVFTQQEAMCPCRDLDIQSSLTGNGPKPQGNQMFIHTLVGKQRSGERCSLLIPAAPSLTLRILMLNDSWTTRKHMLFDPIYTKFWKHT